MTNVVTGMVNALSDHNGQILEFKLKNLYREILNKFIYSILLPRF